MSKCLHSKLHAQTLTCAGTFGRVLECWDRKHRAYVAIKIVRNVKKYRDAAMIEAGPSLQDYLLKSVSLIISALQQQVLPCIATAFVFAFLSAAQEASAQY